MAERALISLTVVGAVGAGMYFFVNRLLQKQKGDPLIEFPDNVQTVSPKVLTQLLKHRNTIPADMSVVHFNSILLQGGVHFNVIRAILEYNDQEKARKLGCPSSIVIKLLNGGSEMTIFNKLSVWASRTLPRIHQNSSTLETLLNRLNGYEIELRFYRKLASEVSVLSPKCYYESEDYYNMKFFCVLEDLTPYDSGQPDGFDLETSKLILKNIAALHAKFWGTRATQNRIISKVWTHGSYWIGGKEMRNISIEEAWHRAEKKLPELKLQSYRSLLQYLIENEEFLSDSCDHFQPKTLVHGDYKITNLFVDKEKSRVFTIDWQWLGGGSCAVDVAYFIYTSMESGSIDDSQTISSMAARSHQFHSKSEYELMRAYFDQLTSELFKAGVSANFEFNTFQQQYMVCVLYFLVFCLKNKYSEMTISDFQDYDDKRQDGLHLRSIRHASRLLTRAYEFSKHIDKESLKSHINFRRSLSMSTDKLQ